MAIGFDKIMYCCSCGKRWINNLLDFAVVFINSNTGGDLPLLVHL